MNLLEGLIEGSKVRLAKDTVFPFSSYMEGLDPGIYGFGIRAHQFSLTRGSDKDVEMEAVVELGEISGSETYIHMSKNGTSWVVVEQGVHTFRLGEIVRVFVDPERIFVYDPSGALVRSPYGMVEQRNPVEGASHGAH